MNIRRVAVTGLGAVSPNGLGIKNFWRNTCEGKSGIDRISSFDASDLACQIAGEVKTFTPNSYYPESELKKMLSREYFALGRPQAMTNTQLDDLFAESA